MTYDHVCSMGTVTGVCFVLGRCYGLVFVLSGKYCEIEIVWK